MASYDEEYASFRISVPERFNPVVDIIERWAGEEPDALRHVTSAGEPLNPEVIRVWEDGTGLTGSREDDVITSSAYRIGPVRGGVGARGASGDHGGRCRRQARSAADRDRCAFVILASGYTPSQELTRDIQDSMKRLTAPYK